MKKNLLLCFTVLSATCFNDSVYGMESENTTDPIIEQPVSIRIQEAQKYSEFARKQCSEDTAHPKLWISSDDSFRMRWNSIADIFDRAVDLYNRNDLEEGDIHFDVGLVLITTITYHSAPFFKKPNASMRETIETLISSLEGIEGSPTNYPEALELWRTWSNKADLESDQ